MRPELRMRLGALLPSGLTAELRTVRAGLIGVARWCVARSRATRIPPPPHGGILLNLGCGPRVEPGWLNLDARPGSGGVFCDFRDQVPLATASVRHIHCEHVLEHLEASDALRLLAECRRILRADGTLRLIVPDAELYLRHYANRNEEFFARLAHLGNPDQPLRTPMEVINQSFRMGGAHRFAWDFQTLELRLKEAGFRVVERSHPGGVEPALNIDGTDEWRLLESLYVNAS